MPFEDVRLGGGTAAMIESHRVEVRHRLTEALGQDDLDAAIALLSAEERTRHDRFYFARDRRDYAVAHALLRTSLARAAGRPAAAWRFDAEPRGKPTLPADDPARHSLSFNLSHTHGLVTCAIAAGADLGVDVERIERGIDADGIAGRYFAPTEIGWLRAAPAEARARRFITLWTLKEAYLKATGEGISESLTKMAFEVSDNGRITFTPPSGIEPRPWQFATFTPAPGYLLSVAVDASRGPMTIDVSEDGRRA